MEGIKSRVEAAGRREPCLERRSSAGGQSGWCGGGGVRYKESRVWYIDGIGSSGSEVDARRDWCGDEIGESWVRWMWLQYLVGLAMNDTLE